MPLPISISIYGLIKYTNLIMLTCTGSFGLSLEIPLAISINKVVPITVMHSFNNIIYEFTSQTRDNLISILLIHKFNKMLKVQATCGYSKSSSG